MRKLNWVEFCNEIESARRELEEIVVNIRKKPGENVPYNFIHMAQNDLQKNGEHEIRGVKLIRKVEDVIVVKEIGKEDIEEYKSEDQDIISIIEKENYFEVETTGVIETVIVNPTGPLQQVLTVSEAAMEWGFDEGTFRKAIKKGKFKYGVDCRKAGRITLITREALEREYEKKNK